MARTNATNALMGNLEAFLHVFSTDGSRHEHPHDHAVAKVILSCRLGRALAFNYLTSRTEIWNDERLMGEFGYQAKYPDKQNADHLRIDLPGI